MTARVFRENGYMVTRVEPAAMVFEKQGSRTEAFVYGGLLESVWIRAEVSLMPAGDTAFRLQCRARLFQGRDMLSEEVKRARINPSPYQKLLDEVTERLMQP